MANVSNKRGDAALPSKAPARAPLLQQLSAPIAKPPCRWQTKKRASNCMRAINLSANRPLNMQPSVADQRRRRRKQEARTPFINFLSSQLASLFSFQAGLRYLDAVFPSCIPLCFRYSPTTAIGIRIKFQNRLLLITGGRLCAAVALKLLCETGQRAISSPLRTLIVKLGTTILSRRHVFKEAPAILTCVTTKKRRSSCVLCVAFHPSAPYIATGNEAYGSDTNTAILWRMSADGTVASCVATLKGHSKRVMSVAFHPSAPVLATGSDDYTAKLWRMSADGTVATCVATLKGHSRSVSSVAFHPSAPVLATGSIDHTAKLWRMSADGTQATCVATLKGHSSGLSSIAFHPSAPLFATGSWDHTAIIWRMSADGTQASCVATLKGHTWAVFSVAFHPCAPVIATGSMDKTAILWRMSADGTRATCVATLKGHNADVNSVAFHPNAPVLATGSDDHSAKLWRMSADGTVATCVATLKGHNSGVTSVAFHPNAPFLATGSWDHTAKLWK
jgi:WD40 repeat protein